MANETIAPIRFSSASFTTTSLGVNDPQVGDFCEEGGRRYVFVYNDGGASAAAGYGVVMNSAATGYSVTVTSVSSADFLIGVVRNATLTTGAYAWVVCRGITSVQMGANASAAVRQNLELSANGTFAQVSNTTGNGPCIGQALTAVASAGSTGAFVSCFG